MGEAPTVAKAATTLALLNDFAPTDTTEREAHAAMVALVADGEAAFSRRKFAPGHFTASAFVVSPDRAQLLLIHHAKLGLWLQPGGHVDAADADLLAAARRELREETGIAEAQLLSGGAFDIDVHQIPAGKEPAHQHFDVRFLFAAPSLKLSANAEVLATRWVPLSEVAQQNSDASVMRAVSRIRRDYT